MRKNEHFSNYQRKTKIMLKQELWISWWRLCKWL